MRKSRYTSAIIGFLVSAAVVGIAFAQSPAPPQTIRVIDGDTIDLDGKRIRLWGIDAPEAKQSCRDGSNVVYLCGQVAAKALRELVRGKEVTCEQRDVDRYRRVVAICRANDLEINREIVRQGWAFAYRQFSSEYVQDEDAARAENRGLWAGTFTKPEQFRKRR